jgi:hypothetical protein
LHIFEETMEVNSDLIDLLRALNAEGAEYLIVGGYAFALHGRVRATKDADIFVGTDSGNAAKVRRALASFGARLSELRVADLTEPDDARFVGLFDRADDERSLERSLAEFVATLPQRTETEARRALRLLKRDLAGIESIDFFSSPAKADAASAMRNAEATLLRAYSPDEPAAISATIARRDRADYRDKTWATREHLWVDRVASAWLIRRFIDPGARFLWLRRPSDCPPSATGFDFDGAEFTHVGDRVTFEVLAQSFGLLTDAALARIGTLVHALDIGDDRVPEAIGLEAVLTGARERCGDDDALLAHFSAVLDDLYHAFAEARPRTPARPKSP